MPLLLRYTITVTPENKHLGHLLRPLYLPLILTTTMTTLQP